MALRPQHVMLAAMVACQAAGELAIPQHCQMAVREPAASAGDSGIGGAKAQVGRLRKPRHGKLRQLIGFAITPLMQQVAHQFQKPGSRLRHGPHQRRRSGLGSAAVTAAACGIGHDTKDLRNRTEPMTAGRRQPPPCSDPRICLPPRWLFMPWDDTTG